MAGCPGIAYATKHRDFFFKSNLTIWLKRQAFNARVPPVLTLWCRDMGTQQKSTVQTCSRSDQNGKTYAQHHIQRQKEQPLGQAEDKSHRHNQQCEKLRVPGHITYTDSKTTDGPLQSPFMLETIRQENTTRETSQLWRDDLNKYLRDTIWQRTAQYRLTWRRHAEAFPDHGAPRLSNDDDGDNKLLLKQVLLLTHASSK